MTFYDYPYEDTVPVSDTFALLAAQPPAAAPESAPAAAPAAAPVSNRCKKAKQDLKKVKKTHQSATIRKAKKRVDKVC